MSAFVLVPMLLTAGCGGGDDKADEPTAPSSSEIGEVPSSAGSPTEAATDGSSEGSTDGYDPGDGSEPAQFPCDKVTADEIGQLLGDNYNFKLGPRDQCDFDLSDPVASPTAYIAIDPFLIDFATLKAANPGATDVDVRRHGRVHRR